MNWEKSQGVDQSIDLEMIQPCSVVNIPLFKLPMLKMQIYT